MSSFVHKRVHESVLRRLRRGQNVLLVGDSGAGKSTVLRQLRASLKARGTVIEVPGVGHEVPLGAFLSHPVLGRSVPGASAPGASSAGASSPGASAFGAKPRLTVADVTQTLAELVGPEHATILIDDVDTMDSVSAAVIDAVLRQHPENLRVVGACGQGVHVSLRMLQDASVEQIPPLPMADVTLLLRDVLEAPVEGGLATAIVGRSGGNPRIARDLVLAAVDDGAVERVRGRWVQTASLDNVPTASLQRSLTAGLDRQLREGLETIAWFGLLRIDHARLLLGPELLTALDAAGRLAVFERATENVVAVSPPVLGHALRLNLTPMRRALIRAQMEDVVGTSAQDTGDASESWMPRPAEVLARNPEDEPVHQQVTILTESMRARASVARSVWGEKHDVASALPLLRLRLLDGVDGIPVDQVFAETSASAADRPEGVASFALFRGQWRAQHGESFLHALMTDPSPSESLVPPELGESFRQRLARLYGEAPGSQARMDAVDDERDVPVPLRGFAAIVRVHDAIEAGAPDRALEIIDRWQGSRNQRPFDDQLNALRGDALLMVGQVDDAIAWARECLSDAYDQLSPFAARLASRGLATALLLAGRQEPARRALSLVLRLGRSGPVQSPFDERIFALAAVLNARSGFHDLAQALLDQLDATERPYAPTFDVMRPWAHAEVAAARGEDVDPEPLWNTGDRLWAEGNRASAVLAWALTPQQFSQPRRDRLSSGFAAIRAPILGPLLRLHKTLAEGASDAIADAAEALHVSSALRNVAAGVAQERAQSEGRDLSVDRIDQIAGGSGSVRPATGAPGLTDREQEIVDLAREGLSNRDIAGRLFLSVRTVESHLYRAMRKLGVSDRTRLAGVPDGSE